MKLKLVKKFNKTKKYKVNKSEKIAEIMGLIEEQEKSKDWLLDELKKLKVKLKTSTVSNSYEILKSSPLSAILTILEILKSDELSVKDIQTFTRTLHWFFTDIVGSSNPNISVTSQARKINALNSFIQKSRIFQKRDQANSVILPTGDGMAIGFADSPEKPLRLAIELHKLLNKFNKAKSDKDKVLVRIGIDSGPVYFIKDVQGNESVWGSGIIMTRRVMDLCGPNQIFVSQRAGDDLRELSPEYKSIMHKIGGYITKHGQELFLYNVYGKNFGNPKIRTKDRIVKKKQNYDPFSPTPKFEFNSIEIHLDISEEKTMRTHHLFIWDIKNISKIPLDNLFYDIGGDVSKDFRDLNVRITDENNKNLEIVSLDSNKEHEKKFHVKLDQPIKKSHTKRMFKCEYDWEEPYRIFEYVFSANCKKFRFFFTAPKSLIIKHRMLEIDRELGVKKIADPAPLVSYTASKTKISWEPKNQVFKKHQALEFQW